jgi:hypothetical protein
MLQKVPNIWRTPKKILYTVSETTGKTHACGSKQATAKKHKRYRYNDSYFCLQPHATLI